LGAPRARPIPPEIADQRVGSPVRRNSGTCCSTETTTGLPPHMDLGRDAGRKHTLGLANGGNPSRKSKIANDLAISLWARRRWSPGKIEKAATSSPYTSTRRCLVQWAKLRSFTGSWAQWPRFSNARYHERGCNRIVGFFFFFGRAALLYLCHYRLVNCERARWLPLECYCKPPAGRLQHSLWLKSKCTCSPRRLIARSWGDSFLRSRTRQAPVPVLIKK
jgi:hypothetical protein